MCNRCKGRIDETTRKLDEMNFPMSKVSPKQVVILRELKKLAVQVYLAKKHCFLNTKLPRGHTSEGGSYHQLHSLKKEAKCYARDVLKGSRNPFNKFDKDPTLD